MFNKNDAVLSCKTSYVLTLFGEFFVSFISLRYVTMNFSVPLFERQYMYKGKKTYRTLYTDDRFHYRE